MGQILENGYELKTTFWDDFTVAEEFGRDAVEETFKIAFKQWRIDVVYVTELVMVMSWKSCDWYGKDDELCLLYANLYRVADCWCMDHLKGKDIEYYIRTTD